MSKVAIRYGRPPHLALRPFYLTVLSQDPKRQKVATGAVTDDPVATNQIDNSEIDIAPSPADVTLLTRPSDDLREQYLHSFFKPQLNAVLKSHRKSQYRKPLPSWPKITNRLQGVSINTISTLRHDFYDGWTTWNGDAFSELPESLQDNSQNDKIQREPASSAPAKTPFGPAAVTRAPPKSRIVSKNKARPKARTRKEEEDDDSESDERTAARSVSTL
jgi:hypothetical protein